MIEQKTYNLIRDYFKGNLDTINNSNSNIYEEMNLLMEGSEKKCEDSCKKQFSNEKIKYI